MDITSPRHLAALGLIALAFVACGSPSALAPTISPAHAPAAQGDPEALAAQMIPLPTLGGAMAPNLAVEGERVAMSWLEPASGGSEEAPARRVRVSFFEEGVWSTPVTVAEGAEIFGNWADVPSITLHPGGAALVHWAQKSGQGKYAYDVRLAISEDGKAWRALGSPHQDGTETEHGFVSAVVEGEGFRVFWLDGRESVADPPGPTAVRTALVTPGSIGPSEVVDPRVCDCCGTGAVRTASGPVVVYRDRSEGEVRDVSIARRSGGGWSSPATLGEDRWQIQGCPVNGPVLVADGDKVAAAWFTAAGGRNRVQVAFSKDSGATFGAPVDVDSEEGAGAPLGRLAAVGLDDGEVLVSWLDGAGEGAVIRAARVDALGRVGQPVDVAASSSARASGFAKAARVGEGVLFVWTVDGPESALRVSMIPLARFLAPSGEPRFVSGVVERGQGWRRPALSARALDGEAVALDSMQGEVALVNLWATWCKPCREEMPALAALHRRFAGRGLRVIGISVDAAESAGELKALVKAEALPYAVWHDPENTSARLFDTTALPASFLFSREGVLLWSSLGAVEAADPALLAAIDAALAAPRP